MKATLEERTEAEIDRLREAAAAERIGTGYTDRVWRRNVCEGCRDVDLERRPYDLCPRCMFRLRELIGLLHSGRASPVVAPPSGAFG